jgi:hypothetical protein
MPKRKSYAIFLSADDRIDVDLEFGQVRGKQRRINRFAITYSAWILGAWREVIRYDNFHGYLHRQRFWRTKQPEPLEVEARVSLDRLIMQVRDDLQKNWQRWRNLMEKHLRGW